MQYTYPIRNHNPYQNNNYIEQTSHFQNKFIEYETKIHLDKYKDQVIKGKYTELIGEAKHIINQINGYNSLKKDTNFLYLNLNGKNIVKSIDDLADIESELNTYFRNNIKIIKDSENLIEYKNKNPYIIYIYLFLIENIIPTNHVHDIYSKYGWIDKYPNTFNLFNYSKFLEKRFEDNHNKNNESFINKFLSNFVKNNDSLYIKEYVKNFFKTLRRRKEFLVLIGNKDVSVDVFYKNIITQIFGDTYCYTLTDDKLNKYFIHTTIENKLFLHIDHIPEDEDNLKKLRILLENLLLNDILPSKILSQSIPIFCQVIITLDAPHPFLEDFLSSSKVFFIDSMKEINKKINIPDRIELLKKVNEDLDVYSSELADISEYSGITIGGEKLLNDLLSKEDVLKERNIHYSDNLVINDRAKFINQEYKTDNEIYSNWLNNPELMKDVICSIEGNPILDPTHNSSFNNIFPFKDRMTHTYITGKTGSGKSELLKSLIYRDILNNDCSVILLDVHGDLANSVAKMVEDKTRLVFIDPSLELDFTPTINLFETNDKSDDNINQISQMISSVINSVNVDDKPSGAMLDILENSISLLLRDKNRDFNDLKLLMKNIYKKSSNENLTKNDLLKIDDSKYNYLIKKGISSKNEFENDYFNSDFIEVSNATRQAVKRRLNKMLKDTIFSNLVNGDNTIDLEKEMNTNGKIIIFKIPKAQMLSTYDYYIKFIIGLIQNYTLKRANLEEEKRLYTNLYIDEFHNFITPAIEHILIESRKYKLFLTLAHQSISQIKDSNLRDIILDNTNVKIVGKNSNKTLDAINRTLNKKLEDVEKLIAGEFFVQSGDKKLLKIRNTDKLFKGENQISSEKWQEHKEYQLNKYYRKVERNIFIEYSEDELQEKLEEFIFAIKNVDIAYFKKLEENIDSNEYKLLLENLNDKRGDVKGYISQPKLNTYFSAIYKSNNFLNNVDLINKLKELDDLFNQDVKNNSKKGTDYRFKIS